MNVGEAARTWAIDISNGLSIPTIVLCAMVAFVWARPAWGVIAKKWDERTAPDWILLGVWIGFTGETLDNVYWTGAWTLLYVKGDETLHAWGAVPNIPFRQLMAIMSAYCHLRAFRIHAGGHGEGALRCMVVWSFTVGAVYAVILYLWRKINGV